MSKSVIVLDGVSCVGKTSSSQKTFDFLSYLEIYPEFANKNATPHLRYVYDHIVTIDVFKYLDSIVNDGTQDIIILDRCFLSTYAYDVLFHFGGWDADPEQFKIDVETVFGDKQLMEYTTLIWKFWENQIETQYPNLDIKLLWVIPTDADAVALNLANRGTFENESSTNVVNYIKNQSYAFSKLAEITNVGKIVEVEQYITAEYIKKNINKF